MGTTAKHFASQVSHSPEASASVPAVFLHDLPARIPVWELNESSLLSRFLPVIVLIPKACAKDESISGKIAASPPLEGVATPKLLGLLGQAVEQLQAQSAKADLVFGDVTVSFPSMEASRNGAPVMLTALEFKTLKYFFENARRVISRDELLNAVWGYENYPCTRTVDNHILKLRQKLERDPSRPVHFLTVHGTGYKFAP
jgi:hypothetical protein